LYTIFVTATRGQTHVKCLQSSFPANESFRIDQPCYQGGYEKILEDPLRQPTNPERRALLKNSTAIGGVALLAFHVPALSRAADDEVIEDFIPNAYIRVSKDNRVTVIVGR
jgi:hypothetical protein